MRRLIVLTFLALVLVAPALTQTAAAAPLESGHGTVHIVQPGETLYGISMRYGVSADAIATANNLVNPNFIYAGQELLIPGSHMPGPKPPPPSTCSYVVQPGDTLSSIAWAHGTTVSALMSANGITNPDYIYAGQTLTIPGCAPSHPVHPPAQPPVRPPTCGYHYTVQPGDTLSSIGAKVGLHWKTIAHANGIGYPYTIYTGQTLFIPCLHGHPHPPKPAPKPPSSGLSPAVCPRERQIVEPLMGQKVAGTLNVIGTATIQDFQFYKLEYAMGHGPLATSFHSIGEVRRTAVWDGVLGTWYTGNMPNGDYTLRLTVVDNRGQFAPPCDVNIYLGN
jgi:LysM repeat protein